MVYLPKKKIINTIFIRLFLLNVLIFDYKNFTSSIRLIKKYFLSTPYTSNLYIELHKQLFSKIFF